MTKVTFSITIPVLIEQIIVWFLLRWRKKRCGYAFRKIKLTKGKYAIVDAEDYEKLAQYNWYATDNGYTHYAERKERILGRKRTVRMHRQIMNAPPFGPAQDWRGKVVDHINRCGWDNRKENLRVVSQQENNWNSLRGIGWGRSKYKGVTYSEEHKKWKAGLCHNGGKIHLGYFGSEIAAGLAYDAAAKKYRGRFAVLNFGNIVAVPFDSAQDRSAQDEPATAKHFLR